MSSGCRSQRRLIPHGAAKNLILVGREVTNQTEVTESTPATNLLLSTVHAFGSPVVPEVKI